MQNRILYRAGLALASFFLAVFVFMPKAFPVLAEDSGMSWSDFQRQLDAASGAEGSFKLTTDLIAGPEDEALVVPSGEVIIDLNGHTIDRNLQEPEENGYVIKNEGTLIIKDSSGGKTGTITGGRNTGDGGGIFNTYALHLDGGKVAGNTAGGNGGGVYNESVMSMGGGTVTGNEAGGIAGGVYTISGNRTRLIISNGAITDNKAASTAGGVGFENNGSLIVSGMVTITGNAVTGEDNENNVYLHRGMHITVQAELDRGSLIGVMTEEKTGENSAVDITVANRGRAKAYNFKSDDTAYGIIQEQEGEAMLVDPVSVLFRKGNDSASGEMEPVTTGKGIEFTFPSCGYDLYGGAFEGWYVNDDQQTIFRVGERKIFYEDEVTLTAVWDTSPWKELQSKIDHARDGEEIVLDPDKEYIARDDDVALRVPSGKNITLDLNGQTIDRNLTEKPAVAGGYVIRVAGTLTIMDSAGNGRITGGNNSNSFPSGETGGGIHITSSGKVTLKSGKIINNQAQSAAGICNNGTLIMEGGSVEYNTAARFSGGIDGVHGTATYIRGGTITRNEAGQLAGGVYASGNTLFSGNPVITGNKADGADENVHLDHSAVLQIDGAIREDALIFITRDLREYGDAPVTMTAGLTDRGTIDAFRPDDSTYKKGYDEDGEMVFGKAGASVSYDATDGSGTMEDVTVCKGAYWLLPECGFTAPSGFVFDRWKTDSQAYDAGEMVLIEGDTTFHAAWKDGPVSLTLRWSSGDGVDLKEPMVISDINKYKTFGDVFLLNNNRIERYFNTDGYTKEGGYSEYGLFLWRPVSDFASTAEARSGDNQVNVDEQLITDREIYIVYSKNQSAVDITLDPVLCGTDTSTASPSASVDEAYYCDLGSAEWRDSSVNKKLAGGEEAKVKVIIKPKAGILFPRNPEVTVNGEQAPVESAFADGPLYVDISVPVAHVPGEVQIENEKAPTCTEPGSHEENIYCTQEICEHKLISSETIETDPALDHDWGEWTVTKQPTETEKGSRIHKCKRCDAEETEEIPAKGYTPGGDPNQKGKDGTAVGPGASEAAADRAITHLPNDNDPAGSVYGKLQAKSTKQTKNSVNVKWNKVKGATKYVIYGNACGKKIKMKKLATSTGKSKTFKKIAGKKVKKGTYYKFIIVALDKNNNVVSTSKIVHVATKGGKVGNHKSVTVKKSVLKKAKKLKKGKSLKLKAKAVKASKLKVKKHRAVSYESSNPKIATVSKKGVVKGKNKGTCYIYAYAQNGVSKKIKVVIK